mmetsp:Transcript_30611/g.49083  ORF Transcript_30611/g.49083 Transcript_30611/m.49083 type:complete len:300 (-) Transcript_30611:244-1143(-)
MGACCAQIRREFDEPFAYSLTDNERNQFARSLCCPSGYIWPIYRTFAAFVILGIMFWAIYVDAVIGLGPWWPIYVSNWSLFVQVIYHFAAAVLTWKAGSGGVRLRSHSTTVNPERKRVSFLLSFVWTLQNVVLTSSLLVTILFWILIAERFRAVSFAVHGINYFLMLIDITFSGSKNRLIDVWQIIVFGFVYIIWTFIHLPARIDNGWRDGVFIYSITNYEAQPLNYLIVILIILILLPVLYLLNWTITQFARGAGHSCGEHDVEEGGRMSLELKENEDYSRYGKRKSTYSKQIGGDAL